MYFDETFHESVQQEKDKNSKVDQNPKTSQIHFDIEKLENQKPNIQNFDAGGLSEMNLLSPMNGRGFPTNNVKTTTNSNNGELICK